MDARVAPQRKRRDPKMKTVTICGSMKFEKEMKAIAFELESRKGMNVLQCTYNEQGVKLTEEMLGNLAKAHFQKIDMSDMIYVVDIDRYIGDSIKREISYALERGKSVVYHSEGGSAQ